MSKKKNKQTSINEQKVKNKSASVKIDKKSAARIDGVAAKLSMHEKFAALYVISMFSIFPVYMTNKLFDVRDDRLHYFVVTTFVLLFFIVATYICGIDKERWPKDLFKMSLPDWAFIAFVGVCLISAILSEYGVEAFTGSGGRDSGFWLMAVYLLCYLLVSRYFRYKEVVFTAFAVVSSVVCFIALLHEFWIDPFKIIVDIKESQQKDFITTIGNINMFSGFVCVSLPVCTALAIISKDKVSSAFYWFTASINFMGLLVANSMSGYFGFVSFMAILFIYCCGSARRLFKFILTCTIMLASAKVLRLMSFFFKDNYKNLEDVSRFMIYDNRVYLIIVAFAVLTAAAYLLMSKYGDEHSPKWVQLAAGGFVAFAAAALLGVFIYFSAIDKTTDLGKLSKILRLNDQWGTHRGYAWIRGFELWHTNGIKNTLVGSGPDTFGQVIKAVYRDDMVKRHGSVFDTAHNEFLNYLVTTGLFGFAAYTTVFVSLVVRCVKRCSKNAVFIIPLLAICAYCSQSIFNLATPIITPYIFLFFGIAEAFVRKADE